MICHGHLAGCGRVNASCVFTNARTHTHTHIHTHTTAPTDNERCSNVRHEQKVARKECNNIGRRKGATDNTRARKYLCGQAARQQWPNDFAPRPCRKIQGLRPRNRPCLLLGQHETVSQAVSQAFFGVVERLQNLHTHTHAQNTAVAGGAVAALSAPKREDRVRGKKNSKLANQDFPYYSPLRHLRSLCPPKCPSLSCFLLCASAVSMSFHRRFAEHGVH